MSILKTRPKICNFFFFTQISKVDFPTCKAHLLSKFHDLSDSFLFADFAAISLLSSLPTTFPCFWSGTELGREYKNLQTFAMPNLSSKARSMSKVWQQRFKSTLFGTY
eukprot:TRINITY_DN8000_c0_g1_i6.p1 TRINITY_DN8000_c0_g1~~TRINITY_DN8000_c0_g1_i6.p1  ORF type:complete len:108 (-),score=0.97 TRINITY_DN8000_c0_g1_i6:228-551(-)